MNVRRVGAYSNEQSEPVSQISGKPVFSSTGKEIGKVKEILVHPVELRVESVLIDRGMFSLGTLVGREYVDSLTKDGVFLNIVPVTEFDGMTVLDVHGAEIGRVSRVNTIGESNSIESLVVERGILGGSVSIPKNAVEYVGDRIHLNIHIDH